MKHKTSILLLLFLFSLLAIGTVKASWQTVHSEGFETGDIQEFWRDGGGEYGNDTWIITEDADYIHSGSYGVNTTEMGSGADSAYLSCLSGSNATKQRTSMWIKFAPDIPNRIFMSFMDCVDNSEGYGAYCGSDRDDETVFFDWCGVYTLTDEELDDDDLEITEGVWVKITLEWQYDSETEKLNATAYLGDVAVYQVSCEGYEATAPLEELELFFFFSETAQATDDLLHEVWIPDDLPTPTPESVVSDAPLGAVALLAVLGFVMAAGLVIGLLLKQSAGAVDLQSLILVIGVILLTFFCSVIVVLIFNAFQSLGY